MCQSWVFGLILPPRSCGPLKRAIPKREHIWNSIRLQSRNVCRKKRAPEHNFPTSRFCKADQAMTFANHIDALELKTGSNRAQNTENRLGDCFYAFIF